MSQYLGVCDFLSVQNCSEASVCKVIVGADSNAAIIARGVFERYKEITGKTPHLIVSHLHRSRLDPNRPIEEAAQGNDEAITAYNTFHGAIETAHKSLHGEHGLHLDFHGYRDIKNQNNTMIGYLYRKGELNEGNFRRTIPSINTLLARTGVSPEQLVLGNKSLGAMFERSGYKAVPSPRFSFY